MDIIVRYENTEKSVRFVSQIGAFLNGAHIPPSKSKQVTEHHFTDLTQEQGKAVLSAYSDIPEVLGVQVDTVPDAPAFKPKKATKPE